MIKLQDFNDKRRDVNMEVAVLVYSKIGLKAASFLGKTEDNNEQNSQFYSSDSLTYVYPLQANTMGDKWRRFALQYFTFRYVTCPCASCSIVMAL